MPQERWTLKNGLTVLLEPFQARSIGVCLAVRAGFKHEEPRLWGSAHLLEHLLFKSNTQMTGRELMKRLEHSGGYVNASTDQEATIYIVDTLTKTLDEALEILFAMYTNEIFRAEEFATERQVVLDELGGYADSRVGLLEEKYIAPRYMFYDTGSARFPEQEVAAVRDVTKEEVQRFKKEYYVPVNTTIAISGGTDPSVVSRIAGIFGGLENGSFSNRTWPSFPRLRKRWHVPTIKFEQGAIILAHRLPPPNHPDTPALLMLSYVLGSGMSSRLFQKIREERGIGYSVDVLTTAYTAFSCLFIVVDRIEPPVSRLREAREIIKRELLDIKKNGPQKEELERAQNAFMFQYAREEHDPRARSGRLIFRELLGLPYSFEETPGRIERVTCDDVRRAAETHLHDDDSAIAVLAPKESKQKGGT